MKWALRAQNKRLYAALLSAAFFLVIAALGPGLFFEAQASPFSWQYQLFGTLCHQDPGRSFSLSGVQMAVCTRCLGIYSLFFAGWLMMPVYAFFNVNSPKTEKNWLIAAILLNLGDVLGNYIGLWTNTHIIRFMLGGLFGWSLTFLLSNEFFTLKKSE